MRRLAKMLAAATFIAASSCAFVQHSQSAPGFWITPTIHGYGLTHMVPGAIYPPEKHTTYKIIYALTKGSTVPTEVNSSLDHVVRAVNVFVASGVPVFHSKTIAIAYRDATSLALGDEAYRAKFGVKNPNLPLIAALRKVGVDVTVCAQAAAENHYEYSAVEKSVTTALPGVTTIVTLQQKGYAYMSM